MKNAAEQLCLAAAFLITRFYSRPLTLPTLITKSAMSSIQRVGQQPLWNMRRGELGLANKIYPTFFDKSRKKSRLDPPKKSCDKIFLSCTNDTQLRFKIQNPRPRIQSQRLLGPLRLGLKIKLYFLGWHSISDYINAHEKGPNQLIGSRWSWPSFWTP